MLNTIKLYKKLSRRSQGSMFHGLISSPVIWERFQKLRSFIKKGPFLHLKKEKKKHKNV